MIEQKAIWYLTGQDGHSRGPYTTAEILHRIARAKIPGGTMCWTEGMSGWKALADTEPFRSAFQTGDEKDQRPIWYLARADGQPEGPLSAIEIFSRLRRGEEVKATLCWREGMQGWQPLGSTRPFQAGLLGLKKETTMGSDTQHVIEEFQRAAGSAAASLRDWGYRLDLSPGSLHEVDRFFRENYRNGKPLPGGKAAGQDSLFVFMIGIYIGEVIRGQSGGDWLLGDPSNPVGTLSLRLSNGEKICPPLWAVGACTAPEEGRVVELCRMAGLNIPDLPATRGDGPLRMPGLQQDAETESFCSTFQVGNEHDQDHLHRCPVCGSENVKKKKPASGNDSLFRFGNFRIYHDRQCSDCSTVWSPAVPRWAAVCCIVAGAVLIGIWGIGSLCVLAADEAAGDNSTLKLIRNAGLLLGIPGGFSVLYGTLTLLGKTGTLRIQ